MVKTISFLFLALILFTGNAKAAFMTNVDDGSFEFRLDIRHMGSYVTYSKLDLFFQDFAGLNEAIVFDDITITSIGQMFVLTESDGNFSASTAFLTNGLPDWIIVSLTTPTRDSYIEGTEPDALFGDPSGDSGIDFAGWSIKSIKLLVTDLVFIYGFDPSQGAYTNIAVQGVVTIEYGGSPWSETGIIGTWSNGIWYWDEAASEWTQMTKSAPTGDIAAGDFTGDGKADVASIYSNGLWYQDGDSLAWTKVTSSAPDNVTAGDVTGDGRAEIIGTWSNGIWYWDVVESKWTQMDDSAPTGDIAAGDFTGDGKADVASCWSNGLWYQDGATLDWAKVSNTAPTQVTAGDITGD